MITLANDAVVRELVRRHVGSPATSVDAIAVVGPRRVLRVRTDSGNVIAKCVQDASLATIASLLQHLGDQMQQRGDIVELAVPQVVAYDEDEHVLLTSELIGVEAKQPDARHMYRCGVALRELHSIDARPLHRILDQATISDHVAELVSPHPLVLADQAPHWRAIIEAALSRLAKLQGVERSSVLHRDFHLRQLLIGERVGVVDWDLAALGDPMFDVAYMLSYLDSHNLDSDGSLASQFLAGYQPTVIDHDRIDTYRAFNLLRRACRRHRLRDNGWLEERDRMLTKLKELP